MHGEGRGLKRKMKSRGRKNLKLNKENREGKLKKTFNLSFS